LLLFDIRDQHDGFVAQPFTQVSQLTQCLIDAAKQRLLPHFPEQAVRYLTGKGANDADKALRIRVVPLPSIGHQHTQADIRRVLIEVPGDCPLQLADVEWAFSGPLDVDLETGEIDQDTPILVKATDRKMLVYYGIGEQKAARVLHYRLIQKSSFRLAAAMNTMNQVFAVRNGFTNKASCFTPPVKL